MYWLIQGLGAIVFIASVVCFILIIIKMFQTQDTTLAIISLVGLLACGLGLLVAFIMGWVNVKKYNAQQIMLIWTICVVVNFVLGGASVAFAPQVNFGP